MNITSDEKLVSVIIPAYNCGQCICDALDSIFNQTHKKFEIVIVDDGSTDNTKEILKPYDEKITYIFQPNRGLANARNVGIKTSRGEYIAFLDGDDVWLPKKIEFQLRCFENYPEVGMVFSDFSSFNEKGTIALSWIKEYFEVFQAYKLNLSEIFPQECKDEKYYSGDISNTMFLGNIIFPSTVLIKRDSFEKAGYLNEKYRHNADYDLFLRITSKYKAGFLNFPTTRARVWDGNFSKTQKYKSNVLEILDIINDFINRNHEIIDKKAYRVTKRLAQLFCQSGTAYISENNLKLARNNFIRSIKYHPFHIKVYLFLMVSMLPPRIVNLLKYGRKRIKALLSVKIK